MQYGKGGDTNETNLVKTQWLSWGGTLKIIWFEPATVGRDTLY